MKTTPSILSVLACSSLLLGGQQVVVEARGGFGFGGPTGPKLTLGADDQVEIQEAEHAEKGPDNVRDVGSLAPPGAADGNNNLVLSHGAANNNPAKGAANMPPGRGAIDLSNNNIPDKEDRAGPSDEGGEGEKEASEEEEEEEEETTEAEVEEEEQQPQRAGVLGALGNLFNIAGGAANGDAAAPAAKPAPPKEEEEEEEAVDAAGADADDAAKPAPPAEEEEKEEAEDEKEEEKEEEEEDVAAGAPVEAATEANLHLPFFCDCEIDFFKDQGVKPNTEELTAALGKINDFLNALIIGNPTFEFADHMEKLESVMNNMGDATLEVYDGDEAPDHYYFEFDSVVDVAGEGIDLKEVRDIVADIVNHADFQLLITQFLWQLKKTEFYQTQEVKLGCTYGSRPPAGESTRLLRRRLLEEESSTAFGGSHKVAQANRDAP